MKIQGDKIDHFLWSCGIFLGATAIFTDILSPILRMTIGLIVASMFGIGKELYDKKHGGIFSTSDLIADGFGILTGAIIYSLLLIWIN